MAQGYERINPPPAAQARHGLLASIPAENVPFAQWKLGITYEPEGCVEGQSRNPCDMTDRVIPTKPDNVSWTPYVLSVYEQCSTFSGIDDERIARGERLLNADTERQLGRELWTGDLSSVAVDSESNPWPNTWLANIADVDILTEFGSTGLVHGLACLEQYLAENNSGKQGAIHATAQVVTHWASFGFLRHEGNRILTFKDTVVITSPGYPGTDPNGNIGDSNVWAYATDLPRIFLGPVQTFDRMDQIDRTDNTFVVETSRLGLVEWERCRHAGVRLDIDQCEIGGS